MATVDNSGFSTVVNWNHVVTVTIGTQVVPTSAYVETSGVTISDRIKELSKDQRKKAALERARSRLANALNSEGVTFTSLRLSKGMSQRDLAELINTQQSYIAKIEKNKVDIRRSTVEKLASALGVSSEVVMSALKRGWELSESGV